MDNLYLEYKILINEVEKYARDSKLTSSYNIQTYKYQIDKIKTRILEIENMFLAPYAIDNAPRGE